MMNSAEFGIRSSECSLERGMVLRTRTPRSPLRIPHSRAAMTLIELLIVIVILGTLTAAALPVLTPSTTERRLREASRELNAYIAQTQASAIARQRPSGVAFKRLSSDTGREDDRGVCLEVYAVEQPAPYTGFDENSRARVALNMPIAGGNRPVSGYDNISTVLIQYITRGPTNSSNLPSGWDADLIPPGTLRPCDEIEIAGTRYEILTPLVASTPGNLVELMPLERNNSVYFENIRTRAPQVMIARPINNTGQLLKPVHDNQSNRVTPQFIQSGNSHPPYWSEPVTYKILRQPTATSAPPFQLPEGTSVDLEASGSQGAVPFHFPGITDNDQPIFLMFSPEGSLERLQYTLNSQTAMRPRSAALSTMNTGPAAITTGNTSGIKSCFVNRPTSNVSLLVGRRELIPAATTGLDFTSGTEADREEAKSQINWLNMNSRWVTIGSQTGSVITTENAFVSPGTLPAIDYNRDGDTDSLDTRMGQLQAAREYAREMRRTGGR